ncbi:MAG: hypothetical protein LIP00_03570, partial [Parabacteroides sp.]|nr:hypothetical protein [Parabacteroides sp.]
PFPATSQRCKCLNAANRKTERPVERINIGGVRITEVKTRRTRIIGITRPVIAVYTTIATGTRAVTQEPGGGQ